jgi:hypothetical protein
VGRDNQLEPGPCGAHQLIAGERVPEPARAKRQPVRLRGHLAVQAQAGGAAAAPAQRGLTPRAVVVQRPPRMVVRPAEHRLLVVRDRFGAHHREPRHRAALPSQPEGLK